MQKINKKDRLLDWLRVGVENKIISPLKAKKLYEEKYIKVKMEEFLDLLYGV